MTHNERPTIMAQLETDVFVNEAGSISITQTNEVYGGDDQMIVVLPENIGLLISALEVAKHEALLLREEEE